MTKLFQALLTGIFFTFIYDYLLFLGMFLHYIKYYEIPEYYNVLFAEHQNIFYIIPSVIIIGFVTTYLNSKKLAFALIFSLLLLSASTLIPTLGFKLGQMVLSKESARYQDNRYVYKGTLYYEGRKKLYLFDEDLQKMITISKKDLKQ